MSWYGYAAAHDQGAGSPPPPPPPPPPATPQIVSSKTFQGSSDVPYIDFTDASTDVVTTPNQISHPLTGDQELIVRCEMADYTPGGATINQVAGKWTADGGNSGWGITFNENDSTFELRAYNNGGKPTWSGGSWSSGDYGRTIVAGSALTDGVPVWLRARITRTTSAPPTGSGFQTVADLGPYDASRSGEAGILLNGKPFTPRGSNLTTGEWVVPGADWLNNSGTRGGGHVAFNQPLDATGIANLKAMNINALRLNIGGGQTVNPLPGQPNDIWHNQELHRAVNLLTSNEIVAMIVYHHSAGSDPDAALLQFLEDGYKRLCDYFPQNPYLWFNLLNEPSGSPSGLTYRNKDATADDAWAADWFGPMISAIRAHEAANGMVEHVICLDEVRLARALANPTLTDNGTKYRPDLFASLVWRNLIFDTSQDPGIMPSGKTLTGSSGGGAYGTAPGPYSNVIASIHPYGADWINAQYFEDYLLDSWACGIPTIFGEWGGYDPNGPSTNKDTGGGCSIACPPGCVTKESIGVAGDGANTGFIRSTPFIIQVPSDWKVGSSPGHANGGIYATSPVPECFYVGKFPWHGGQAYSSGYQHGAPDYTYPNTCGGRIKIFFCSQKSDLDYWNAAGQPYWDWLHSPEFMNEDFTTAAPGQTNDVQLELWWSQDGTNDIDAVSWNSVGQFAMGQDGTFVASGGAWAVGNDAGTPAASHSFGGKVYVFEHWTGHRGQTGSDLAVQFIPVPNIQFLKSGTPGTGADTVALVGDSILNSCRDELDTVLDTDGRWFRYVEATGGWTTTDALAEYDHIQISGPEAVVIALGTNDTGQCFNQPACWRPDGTNVDPQINLQNFTDLATRATDCGASFVMAVNIVFNPGLHSTVNNHLDALATAGTIDHVADWVTHSASDYAAWPNSVWFADQVGHLTAAGQTEYATFIKNELNTQFP